MAPVIYKYNLDLVDTQLVKTPSMAEWLTVQVQNNKLALWGVVNPEDKDPHTYEVLIFGTGNPADELAEYDLYVGTVQIQGGALVWHVFIRRALV